jgi:hypothetical protein
MLICTLTVLVYMVQHLFIRTCYLIDDVSINELFIKAIGSPKYQIASFNNKHAELHSTAIPYENKLIHEHVFIPSRIKEGGFLIHCTTCDMYYCEFCRKAL